jgi:nucleotide-binding universal stress UspA family protein
MYHDILVPTDGSDASTQAVEHAVALAAEHDATVHVLYVVDASSYASLDVGTEMIFEALRDEGESVTATAETAAAEADVPVESEVVEGDVHRAILDYAAAHDADLIVMGTHGRRGLDRYLLGSVTERIVRSSPVPVLTVRQGSGDAGSASEPAS